PASSAKDLIYLIEITLFLCISMHEPHRYPHQAVFVPHFHASGGALVQVTVHRRHHLTHDRRSRASSRVSFAGRLTLTGPHGAVLRHMGVPDSHPGQVRRAIALIRARYQEQLRIDEIAAAAGMSTSSLHAHFKAITRMTPLEYQKHLRLQEARR